MNIRQWVSPLLFLFALLQLAASFVSSGFLDALVSLAAFAVMLVMLVLTGRSSAKRTSIVLLIAGTAMLAAGGLEIGELAEGVRFYGNIATLVLLAPLLALPVFHGGFDRAMKTVLDALGKRVLGYAAISSGLTFFTGIFLNIGCLGLIHSLTDRGDEKWRRVQALSMLRGFAAAMLISPYSIAVAMIVSFFHIGFIELVSVSALISAAFMILHFAECLLAERKNVVTEFASAKNEGSLSGDAAGKRLAVLAMALVLFIASLLLVESVTNYPMVALVSAFSVAVPLIGFAAMGEFRRLLPVFRERYWNGRLPDMGKETLLVLSAGYFGYAIQQSGAAERVTEWLSNGNGWSALAILCLIHLLTLAFAVVGFHPIVVVSVLTSILSADSLGLPPGAEPVALLASWSLSIFFSPFSASAIITGELIGKSSAVVSLLWNWRYTLAALALVLLIEYLFFFA